MAQVYVDYFYCLVRDNPGSFWYDWVDSNGDLITETNKYTLLGLVTQYYANGNFKIMGEMAINQSTYFDDSQPAVYNSLINSVLAAQTIAKYDVVTGNGFKADSSNLTHFDKVVGISFDNTILGFWFDVITDGIIENPLWTWSIGNIIYLNGTSLSIIPPTTGFVQKIGVAVKATKIYVEIENAIKL